MKYLIVLLVLVFFTGNTIYGQKLSFKISGVPDTTIHLVKYVGSKLYYADTAEIKGGNVVFDGAKQEPGIMAVLLPDQKYFEFVFNKEDVHMETKSPDFVPHMKVKKSKENKIFYSYIHYLQEQQNDSKNLMAQKEALDPTETDKIEGIDAQIKEVGNRVSNFQRSVVAENPETLVSKILKMSIDVEIPESPDPSDSTFKYRYYRDHFFDNIDLTDDRLVNTPVIQRKLEYFLSPQMLIQHPDTMVKYVSKVVDQIEPGTMMYRFFVTKSTGHFEKSKIMGMDKAFNIFVDRYYCGEGDPSNERRATWMDDEKLADLCKDTKTRLRLVQGEVPPNLILTDSTSKKWYNLHELDADYVILYFWDPGCGHCKKETPKLQKLYAEKLKDRNVEVFAVGKATGDDFEAWKKFVKDKGLSFINVGVTKEIYSQAKSDARTLVPSKTTLESLNYQETYDIFSTPKVWILDKDKKIVGKSLGVAQIEEFLDKLQGVPDAPKLFEVESAKDKVE